MNVLVINCGSSSLKFSVFDTDSGENVIDGLFDQLGSSQPKAKLRAIHADQVETETLPPSGGHREALDFLASYLQSPVNRTIEFQAVGHRVVHGGESFNAATLIDDATLEAIDACATLAPLHNPVNALGIRTALQRFPGLPQVAVFDTAFHQTLPRRSYLYPLPYSLYQEHRVRRYGFHGTSHKYVAGEAARLLGKPLTETSLVIAHLGNGCSATAVKNGQSVDTSMGLTPLEGLVMGTRSGSIDPGIVFHLHRSLGLSIDEIDTLLNKQSGLLGLSGSSNDMRTLRKSAAEGDAMAIAAIEVFVHRLAKTLSGLRASLDQLDALVFTGGIGENDSLTRQETIARLGFLGVRLDEKANTDGGKSSSQEISTTDSSSKVLVVPTNEELMIARETEQTLSTNEL